MAHVDITQTYGISDISALSGLTNLTEINLSHNRITDWSPVAQIENVIGRPE